MLHSFRDLEGRRLCIEKRPVGRIKQIFFDDQKWAIRYLVAVSGFWPIRNYLLIPPQKTTGITKEEDIQLSITEAEFEKCPTIESDKPVSRQKEAEFCMRYRWPMYWTGAGVHGAAATAETLRKAHCESVGQNEPTDKSLIGKSSDPHLRSSAEVLGYRVETKIKKFGSVFDLIIDEGDWTLRYFSIDTVKWWPSRHVLLAPSWISSISWNKRSLIVNLSDEDIKSAPAYDRHVPITRDYEERLYSHYQHPDYWTEQEVSEIKKGIRFPWRKSF